MRSTQPANLEQENNAENIILVSSSLISKSTQFFNLEGHGLMKKITN